MGSVFSMTDKSSEPNQLPVVRFLEVSEAAAGEQYIQALYRLEEFRGQTPGGLEEPRP
jgi:hypothetical protein